MKNWTVTEGQTVCPHCKAVGTIAEVDTAIRWNTLELSSNGATAVAHTGGNNDFEFTGWICTGCLSELITSPEGFEILDWI